jgi:chromate transporter
VSGNIVLQLFAILAPLSLVAVGGAVAVMPEIHRQVVEVQQLLTDPEFAELFALAQVAPGPNILVVSLIGWKLAGWAGAVTALLSFCVPSSVLTIVVFKAWGRLAGRRWIAAIQAGLAPIAIGFVMASGVILGGAVVTSPVAYLATAAATVLVMRTRVHPLILMGIAAVMGVIGLM